MFIWNDNVLNEFKRGLDAAALRHKVIANNLANINTPRFKRSEVTFEDDLLRAKENQLSNRGNMRATHHRHFSRPEEKDVLPQIKEDMSTTKRIDGNNVDMEREMMDMVKNQLYYNTIVQRTTGRLQTWKTIITEGRG